MEKQIKYDFSRCNNLSFNRNIGGKIIKGYLKVNGDEVYMHYKGENSYSPELQINIPDYLTNIHGNCYPQLMNIKRKNNYGKRM